MDKQQRFVDLNYETFRELAKDSTLSRHEKVGFPDAYREGMETDIFVDISEKLKNLRQQRRQVLEIGPGCSDLPFMLADLCKANNHELLFVDNEEMLSHLPDGPEITKVAGSFPDSLSDDLERLAGRFDVILAYSVIQYPFNEGNLWRFLDVCLMLLADGGELLLGDIPNASMRKRFFASESGKASHKAFTGEDDDPAVLFNRIEPGHIDDSVVLALVSRARIQGFQGWICPQSNRCPMANRREDILIKKP